MELPDNLTSGIVTELSAIERQMGEAYKRLVILNTVYDQSERSNIVAEYEKLMQAVMSQLNYLSTRFLKTAEGTIGQKIRSIDDYGRRILGEILRSASLDPEGPGLSERVVLKEAATLTKTKTEKVKTVLDGLKQSSVVKPSTADLLVGAALMIEIGWTLWKKLLRQAPPAK
jgi:hypothetical protein